MKLRYLIVLLYLSSAALVVFMPRMTVSFRATRLPRSPQTQAYASWLAHVQELPMGTHRASDLTSVEVFFEMGARSNDLFVHIIVPETREDWKETIPPCMVSGIVVVPIAGAKHSFQLPRHPTRLEIYFVNYESGEEFSSAATIDPSKGRYTFFRGVEFGSTRFVQNDEGWLRD